MSDVCNFAGILISSAAFFASRKRASERVSEREEGEEWMHISQSI